MTSTLEVMLPPADADAFESLCLDLFREVWRNPSAQKNGRRGQRQTGVDIFGSRGGKWIGVQCKLRDQWFSGKLSVTQLKQEIEAAKSFSPKLSLFVLATTSPRDAALQKYAREQSSAQFAVEIWSWPDIWHEIYERPELFGRIFRVYWPLQAEVAMQRIRPSVLLSVAQGLFGRENELSTIQAAWESPQWHVVAINAWAGAGKTSLVAKWCAQRAASNYDGANYFDWTFQQTAGGSPDAFIDTALRYFGGSAVADSTLLSWEKGTCLAKLVSERRTILVLDGLESVQKPPSDSNSGAIVVHGIVALLRGLAQHGQGLCLITTRARVVDLEPFFGSTALEIDLPPLSVDASVEFLHALKVHGPLSEMRRLAHDLDGHALTIDLIGGYLAMAHDGDLSRRDRVDWAIADTRTKDGRVFGAIQAYVDWFLKSGIRGKVFLSIMGMVALFDRAVHLDDLAAIRQPPAIDGLTDALTEVTQDDWNIALHELVICRLLSRVGATVDCHALVREFFARLLREGALATWREAQGRLFTYFSQSVTHLPQTLAETERLYRATRHGCLAGFHDIVLESIYKARLHRGEERYSWRKFGAFTQELETLACFFDTNASKWRNPSGALSERDRAFVLCETGFALQALGRMNEASEPMSSALRAFENLNDHAGSALAGRNLSKHYLYMGDLHRALVTAERAVVASRMANSPYHEIGGLCAQADALFQLGERATAEDLFVAAESLHAAIEPTHAQLYAFRGYRYCELLVDARPDEALMRAQQWLQAERSVDIAAFSRGLTRVMLVKGMLALPARCDIDTVTQHIEDGLVLLRSAAQSHHEPRALLTRASLRASCSNWVGAKDDVSAAKVICAAMELKVLNIECDILAARILLQQVACGIGGEAQPFAAFVAGIGSQIAAIGANRFASDLLDIERAVSRLSVEGRQ